MTGVRIKSTEDGSTKDIAVHGCFIAIGHKPNTDIFAGQLEMDNGYIVTRGGIDGNVDRHQRAGGLRRRRRAGPRLPAGDTTAGTGCMAALDADKYLESLG